MGQGRGKGGKILEEVLLRGFERGVGARWRTAKRVARVEDLRSFWARNDRSIVGTISNEEWPCAT